MIKGEYVFSCKGDLEDLNYLHKLFIINGIESKKKSKSTNNGEMGLKEDLVVLITSSTFNSVINIIIIWMKNRKKEIKIVDKCSGREINLKSYNGKGFSDSQMDKLTSFFKE